MGVRESLMSNFDNKMIIATLIIITLEGVLIIFGEEGQYEFSKANYILGLFIHSFFCFFCIYLIKKFRGKYRIEKKEVIVLKQLGVWGYFWRGLITIITAFIISTIFMTVFIFGIEMPSIRYTIVFSIILHLSAVIIVWLLFSKNRKQQINWFGSMFCGY